MRRRFLTPAAGYSTSGASAPHGGAYNSASASRSSDAATKAGCHVTRSLDRPQRMIGSAGCGPTAECLSNACVAAARSGRLGGRRWFFRSCAEPSRAASAKRNAAAHTPERELRARHAPWVAATRAQERRARLDVRSVPRKVSEARLGWPGHRSAPRPRQLQLRRPARRAAPPPSRWRVFRNAGALCARAERAPVRGL